jgi:hypothetical protein
MRMLQPSLWYIEFESGLPSTPFLAVFVVVTDAAIVVEMMKGRGLTEGFADY